MTTALQTKENPFGSPQVASRTGMVAAEQQRAIAEIQAAVLSAKGMPRDRVQCLDLIVQDCTDPALAEEAEYEFSRGGSNVSGPSIRLLETVARRWGNMECGVKELSRQDGMSECEAYAWDMESNFRDRKVFQVKHWRDTRKGGHAITDERDIYELVANNGARRKRACMEAVIPRDVIEQAVKQCQLTLKTSIEIDDKFIAGMLEKFTEFGVTKEQIEKRIQRHIDALTPALAMMLRKIYNSLKSGMSAPAAWFEAEPAVADAGAAPKTGAAALKEQALKTTESVAASNGADEDVTQKIAGVGTDVARDPKDMAPTPQSLMSMIVAAQNMSDVKVALLKLEDVEATLSGIEDAKEAKKLKHALADVRQELQNRK